MRVLIQATMAWAAMLALSFAPCAAADEFSIAKVVNRSSTGAVETDVLAALGPGCRRLERESFGEELAFSRCYRDPDHGTSILLFFDKNTTGTPGLFQIEFRRLRDCPGDCGAKVDGGEPVVAGVQLGEDAEGVIARMGGANSSVRVGEGMRYELSHPAGDALLIEIEVRRNRVVAVALVMLP